MAVLPLGNLRRGSKQLTYMNNILQPEPEVSPKSMIDLLRENRDKQAKEVEALQEKLDAAKKELSRLDKAIKQWEPKE